MDEDRYRDAERRLWAVVGASPVEQHITLPRIGTRVRIQVVGEGPTMVFVHGASTNGTVFASLAAHLAGFRCVLLDRPGCGLSDALSGTLTLERLPRFAEELVVDLLDALDLERAHLLGTSFGGYVTLQAAAAQPDRVDRLVLLGWTVGAPITRVPAIMRLASIPGLGLLMAAIPPNERAVRSMLRQVGLRRALAEGRVSQELIDHYLALLRDTDTMRNEIRQGPPIITPLRGYDEGVTLTAEMLASVRAPTCLLWGEDDLFGGPETARRFAADLPHAELEVLPGAGHAPWLDQPEHVANRIAGFLNG